ncbi:CatB-related O-acetyltransferase [Mesorhizobium koreense]|jgi:acetyltransferase-like isoleucine patch superfamily enzyme|uniref:CatB-related O-acetyltransferase n=1 Tax=Mesorhizobium koreense TaxID=3074855 RepID=UPI00287B5C3B|nr:CatB-related O-acetyltransferase [Mesorhizobium sp. WR6]
MFGKARKKFGLRKAEGELPEGVRVGRHSYGVHSSSIDGLRGSIDIEIGSFCSIAKEALFLQNEHTRTTVSTWPFDRAFDNRHCGRDLRGPIRVGNDVWIGRRAVILSGVTIGDGAIIGAGAVVTKDVPPYAVVVGNPARVARYRFDQRQIDALLELRWWTWSDEKIQSHSEFFLGSIDKFIEKFQHSADRTATKRSFGLLS